VQLLDDLVAVLDRMPRARGALARLAELEGVHAGDEREWLGAEWHELEGVSGSDLARLAGIGILVRHPLSSNKHRYYRLADPDATRRALTLPAVGEPLADGDDTIPDDLFSVVTGHDVVKVLILRALMAERPVHVLLEGGPGSAKSLLLDELARLGGSRYILGQTTTRAGLVDVLLAGPRYLLIDEIADATDRDLSILLPVMESGRVSRTHHGRHEERRTPVSVFAACNSSRNLRPALLARFMHVLIPEYAPDELQRVMAGFLVEREGVEPELAEEIAARVARRSRNVRHAAMIARLAGGDRRVAAELIDTWL